VLTSCLKETGPVLRWFYYITDDLNLKPLVLWAPAYVGKKAGIPAEVG